MYRTIFIAGLMLAATTAVAEPAAKPDLQQRVQDIDERVKQLETGTLAADQGGMRTTSSAFNPSISLILDGKLSAFSQDPATYALPGFALGEETGPGDEGLRLGESELVMSANIDDKFYGQFTAALTPENETEIEEAFFETLALGGGATLKAGRFFSHIGYLNPVHAHAWDFADQPLVYRALLGNQYGDDGVQARWVTPTDVFVEVGAELFRGDGFPAGGAANTGKGTHTVFVHIGGDAGVSHAWRIGLSRLDADAKDRASGDAATPDLFTGTSKLTGVDFIWKWAPNGNPRQTNFKFQTEYFTRDEDGTFDPASSGTPLTYNGKQKGWYTQAVYQFMPRWRAGLRTDRLKADAVGAAFAGTALDNQGHDPKRTSAMVDFSNSEFSRLRFQVNRDESRVNQKDTQWYLQYIMSLGAHGAHSF
ncbi:MAG: hypothetical protein WD823_03245 [Sulfuricaulis sp.]|uniref:hypothetical protein n=1 Tax=Sulfuricaulis sp. TaxID=2003553 RepID=UPI0034A29D17